VCTVTETSTLATPPPAFACGFGWAPSPSKLGEELKGLERASPAP
jgi:hypothetical protein